jgi:phosphoribosylformimino-5-aminoimidazole carboxamide ribonucleotide (ProFAR) isomerase
VELYPAVDVQGGRVARAPAAAADPLAVLERYARAGARWAHFVDLDRAYGRGSNDDLTRACLRAAGLRVQVGGGIATEAAVDELLSWGAARVVLGAVAAADEGLVDRLLARHGVDQLAVGIDARHGKLAPRGSRGGMGAVSDIAVTDLARRLRAQGARTVVYTDVTRDGTLEGPDLAGARAVGAQLDLDVIISGGVASLEDLRAARAAGLAGAIVGRALHEARFTLAEALTCVA